MVSYQIFTQSAVTTIASSFEASAPVVASWIHSSAQLTSFVCSFAWMFVLSTLISIIMFGKERRLTIQFLVSLALTTLGTALLGVIDSTGLNLSNPDVISGALSMVFGNVFFAFLYLALPFIFMVAVDLHVMKIKQ